jgi:hypothetical protein
MNYYDKLKSMENSIVYVIMNKGKSRIRVSGRLTVIGFGYSLSNCDIEINFSKDDVVDILDFNIYI